MTTNGTNLQPGFYLFLTYTILAIVPVDHQGIIASHFPNAVVRTLAGHGHEYKKWKNSGRS
jgi:hypothetical protein